MDTGLAEQAEGSCVQIPAATGEGQAVTGAHWPGSLAKA